MRKHSPTHQVAYVFITEILGQTWGYTAPHCRRALRDAKFFVNHAEHGPVAGTKEESAKRVIKTLRAMKRAGIRMNSIHSITWGNGAETWYDTVNRAALPPIYHALDVRWSKEERAL